MIRIGQSTVTLDTPIEHLMACHRRIEDRLTTLERASDLLGDSPDAAIEALAGCIRFLDSSGALHTVDEEESLFPRLRPQLAHGELAYLDSLEQQHREAEAIYAELKEVIRRLPDLSLEDALACRDLASRLARVYREHIRSEDAVLTALARRSLDESALQAISAEMKARRQRA